MQTKNRAAICLVVGFTAAAATGTAAQDTTLVEALRECADEQAGSLRLQCFDEAVLKHVTNSGVFSADATPTADMGAWTVDVQTNPLDDTRRVVAILVADEGQSSLGEPIGLVLECSSRKTRAWVVWNDYLGNSDVEVTWRLGTQKSRTKGWPVSTNYQATFYPDDEVSFIRGLLIAGRLVVNVTPYGENPVTAIFDLAGIAAATADLRSTCRW